jgi:hypothetical protein
MLVRAEKEAERQKADERVRSQIRAGLEAAANTKDLVAQEHSIRAAMQLAERNDGLFSKRWAEWTNGQIETMRRENRLRRGDWLGHAAHVHLLSDRILWTEQNQLFVKPVDAYVRASMQTAGAISKRPTLTRMAIGSMLPGTALIPGLAFQKKTDSRELYFVIEHPEWSKIVQLQPDAHGAARQLVVSVNQASARVAFESQKRREEEAASPSAPPAPPALDYLDELKRLGELRDAGVLTEAEFTEQKARILRRDS